MRDHIKLTSKSLEVTGPGAVKVAMAWFGLRAFGILAGLGAAFALAATGQGGGLDILNHLTH
ncbi:MAG: hypothetical protein EOP19_00195 [Hyphomicrobiales bacterium]|nr:MAG: hypothetical protein EOP19_00195 [Hyphomicrobiales bacterium]